MRTQTSGNGNAVSSVVSGVEEEADVVDVNGTRKKIKIPVPGWLIQLAFASGKTIEQAQDFATSVGFPPNQVGL